MKTIEEASLENSKAHYCMAFSEELHFDADMDFRAGVEFGRQLECAEWQEKTRWKEVGITPKSFPMYLNFKVGKCILCKKVDSLIEYYNLERAYRFTYWREIIE